METWSPMSKEEVNALFEKEAVLFGERDGIPLNRATQLFGIDAIQFAQSMEQGEKAPQITNGYGIGNYTAWFLTSKGTRIAATYNNVLSIKEDENKHNETTTTKRTILSMIESIDSKEHLEMIKGFVYGAYSMEKGEND